MSAYPHIGGPGDAWTYDASIDPQRHVSRYCECGEEVDGDDDHCDWCRPTRCAWCTATPPSNALRTRDRDLLLCADCAADYDATCERCGTLQDSPDDLTNNLCRECAAKGS